MNVSGNSIPLLLWQTYKDRASIKPAVPLIRSWRELNPEYQYTFVTDDEIDAFMVDEHAFTRDLVRHHFGSRNWLKHGQYESWIAEGEQFQTKHSCHPTLNGGWVIRNPAMLVELRHTNGARVQINSSAAQILSYCDGVTSVAHIVRQLAQQFDLPQDQLWEPVWSSINSYAALGILDLKTHPESSNA